MSRLPRKVLYKVLYVDDVQRDRVHYRKLLEGAGTIRVKAVPAPPDLGKAEQLLDPPPDLLLVDYELTLPDERGERANYLGATLAWKLRETMKEHPIVLLTRRGLQQWKDDRVMQEKLQTFDGIMYKGDIARNADPESMRLVIIASGFSQLRKCRKTWKGLLRLMDVQDEVEEDALKQALPPMGWLLGSRRGSSWRVSEAARWIQYVLLAYPGILYDSLHSATSLGIDNSSFLGIQGFFDEAKYIGCFSPADGRWWKPRLIQLATRFIREQGLEGPIWRHFASAYRSRFGSQLDPARCVYSGEEPANWVCCILKRPVMLKYSLPYHFDQRPVVMDEARVSFTAVKDTNEVDEKVFDTQSREVVKRLTGEGI